MSEAVLCYLYTSIQMFYLHWKQISSNPGIAESQFSVFAS